MHPQSFSAYLTNINQWDTMKACIQSHTQKERSMYDINAQALDMLDAIQADFQLPFQPEDQYATILTAFQTSLPSLTPSHSLRQRALDFIETIACSSTLLQAYILPDVPTDLELLTLLGLILASTTYKQHGSYVLMKYTKSIWAVSWNSLSLHARGKVLDIHDHHVVAYPFDKFFNLDENPWTSQDYVRRLIAHSQEINVTEKKDGTAIIVTNTGSELLIHTSGDWDNAFTRTAHALFQAQYPLFYHQAPTGYTFIFELIVPDNKIVVDYGQEKALYLLAMRNLSTQAMESHEKLEEIAQKFALPLPTVYRFSSLDEFLTMRTKRNNQVAEGWVFRLRFHQGEFLFKLKYEQYFELHHFYEDTSLKRVYNAWCENKLDDMLPSLNQENKEKALGFLAEILVQLKDYDTQLDALVTQIHGQYGTQIPFAQVSKTYQTHFLKMYLFARLRGNPITVTDQPPTYAKYAQWLLNT